MNTVMLMTCADWTKLKKTINQQPDMVPAGTASQPQTLLHLLNARHVRTLILSPEEAGLSLMHTQTLMDGLCLLPRCPIVILCTDYRELASHSVCTYWFPRDTDETLIVKRIRMLSCPCGTPEERMQVEGMLMNFGLLPGSESFRSLRDTVLFCLHEPVGSNSSLDGIFREVAAIRGSSRYSVSQAIRFCARNLFTDRNGLARVMKYCPEACLNLQRSGRTVPTNLEFVLMFTDLLATSSRSWSDALPAGSRQDP